MKRGIIGVFHHVSGHHLHRYLPEFDFQFSLRRMSDSERTLVALLGIEGKRILGLIAGGLMSKGRFEYRLIIDAYTPETMPMSRLAEYMADLSMLLGHHDRVHFVRLEGGSTALVHSVEKEAQPKVEARCNSIMTGEEAPPEARRAYRALDSRLEQDNAFAVLRGPRERKIIDFPGVKKPKSPVFGPFNQEGEIVGSVILIGGKNDPVPVHVEYGETVHNCYADRVVARELGHFLFGPLLRLRGLVRWRRNELSEWEMIRFTIHSHKEIGQRDLKTVLQELREVKSPLQSLEDPVAELLRLRKGESVN